MKENWLGCMGVKLLPALHYFVNTAKYGQAFLQGDDLQLITIQDLQFLKTACDSCSDLYFYVDSFEGMPLKLLFERANEYADSISSDINRVDVSQYDRIYGAGMGERALDKVREPRIWKVVDDTRERLSGNAVISQSK